MSKNLLFLRGARVLQWLEETTYADLERNTLSFVPPSKHRQFDVNPIQVVSMELVPARPSQQLTANAEVNNQGRRNQSTIVFKDVIYEDTDQNDNVTFTGADGEEYNIIPINLNRNNVQVRCSCLDFRWRFAIYNARDDSLYGEGPGPYQKRTDRPPNNQRRVPGVCKHLMKTVISLREAGLIAPG